MITSLSKIREALEFAGSLVAESKFNGFSDLVTLFRDTPLYKEAEQAIDQAQRDTERLQQALNGYVPDQAIGKEWKI